MRTAVEYYTKASNASHAPATASLASCYFYGTLRPPLASSLSFLRSRHDTRHREGGGEGLEQGDPALHPSRRAGQQAGTSSSFFFSSLFILFNSDWCWYGTQAEFRLGQCYEEGDGVDVDHTLAAQYYARAAAKQLPEAMVSLGLCYKLGKGVELDAAKVRPHPRSHHRPSSPPTS